MVFNLSHEAHTSVSSQLKIARMPGTRFFFFIGVTAAKKKTSYCTPKSKKAAGLRAEGEGGWARDDGWLRVRITPALHWGSNPPGLRRRCRPGEPACQHPGTPSSPLLSFPSLHPTFCVPPSLTSLHSHIPQIKWQVERKRRKGESRSHSCGTLGKAHHWSADKRISLPHVCQTKPICFSSVPLI